jgi:hypothetical protein
MSCTRVVVSVSADSGRRKLELKAVNGTISVGLTTVAAWPLGALVATAAADLPMYFCFQYAALRGRIDIALQDTLLGRSSRLC